MFFDHRAEKNVAYAPYTPSDQPTKYSVKIKAPPHFIFSMLVGPTAPPTLKVQIDGYSQLVQSHGGNEMADSGFQVLAQEIAMVGKGVSIKSKPLADKRCENLVWEPLWSNIPGGYSIVRAQRALKLANEETDGAFDFWITWYEHLLAGTLPDQNLLKRLAGIEDRFWSLGPKAVATEIKRIQADFQIYTTPLAETVEINPDTQLFRAVPIQVQNAPFFSTLLGRVGDALEDAVQGANGLNDRSREVRVLTRSIARYGNDPQRLEMDFASVASGLRRQIHDTGELPDSEDNLALLETLQDSVRGLRATHPDVAANRELLAVQTLKELDVADKALLEKAKPVLVALSEDIMAEDFAADIPALLNDALGPLPDGAPRLPGADPAVRIFNRTAKMALLWEKGLDGLTAAHDSRVHKVARLGMTTATIGGLLYAVVRIGLKAFGVL